MRSGELTGGRDSGALIGPPPSLRLPRGSDDLPEARHADGEKLEIGQDMSRYQTGEEHCYICAIVWYSTCVHVHLHPSSPGRRSCSS